jgi:hypothetical protein
VTIKLVIRNISCFSVNSNPLFSQVLSMIFNSSFMGMFVYVFEISSEAILRFVSYGMFLYMFEISSEAILRFVSYGMLGLSSSVQSSERCKHKGVASIS